MNTISNNDTICALSTAPGNGAIAVARLSGQDAIAICDRIFMGKKLADQPTHTLHFGKIHKNSTLLDEVVIGLFKAPNSYTGENVIEISCHGSHYIQQQLLELLVAEGARLAKPGEFTQRAFFNGKMDLSQAEAVADVIASESKNAHQVAMKQMRGGFSSQINDLRQKLVEFAALVELELDFSEEDVEFANRKELVQLINTITQTSNQLIESFQKGNVIKNGVPVVIAGKPNVGKSTLLNALLNEERAIVSHIAGTTRDVIEDEVNLEGIRFRFLDTAGIRETTDEIEKIGVKRTLEKIQQSAIVLFLFDVHEVTERELAQILEDIKLEMANSGAKLLMLGNKIDHESFAEIANEFAFFDDLLLISAKQGNNLDELKTRLVQMVNIGEIGADETILTNARHVEALIQSNAALDKVIDGLNTSLSGDLLAVEIRDSLRYLGEITGQEITNDELLGTIFGRFCIGK